MTRQQLAALFTTLLCLTACDVDPVTTASTGAGATGGATTADPSVVTASDAATAPIISEVKATPNSTGNVVLKVTAVDPGGKPMTFAWKVDQGTLTTSTGPSTLWQPPKTPGVYTATVEVVNSRGLKRSALQTLTVSGDGTASVSAQAQVTGPVFVNAAAATAAQQAAAGSGQFQLPIGGAASLPSSGASTVVFVTPNPAAPTPTPAITPPPFSQPVATPVPGASVVASPVTNPVASPTPTPVPASPTPFATPTPKPATPQPGVKEPPDSTWSQVPVSNVGTTQNLQGVFFLDQGGTFNLGWAVGDNGTIIRTTNGGVNWTLSNTGVPAGSQLKRVAFASSTIGFATGQSNFKSIVLRTRDGGATWEDMSPDPTITVGFPMIALCVYGQDMVAVATSAGRVLRSNNASLVPAGSVSWTSFDTKSAPNTVNQLAQGACFTEATEFTLGWFVGDNIYQLDSDNATAPWTLKTSLGGTDPGVGTCVDLISQADIWIGTNTGKVLFSTDRGNTFSKISSFNNREFGNGPNAFTLASIADISFVDPSNGFLSTADGKFYDTRNRGQSWRQRVTNTVLRDLQMQWRTVTDASGPHQEYFGWGVGSGGAVFRYLPQ